MTQVGVLRTRRKRRRQALTPVRALLAILVAHLALGAPVFAHGLQAGPSGPGGGGELSPGRPIQGESNGGETHSYRIYAQAGQFLHVAVEQHGIHLVLMLFTPEGRAIARTDMLNGVYGTDSISAIAPDSGEFRLDIASTRSGAPAGSYIARLTDLRPPTPADRMRMGAEQLYMEGGRLFLRDDAESKRAAIPKWEQSLELWRTLMDAYDVALAANSISYAYNVTGDKQKSLDSLLQAAPLWHAANDPVDESAALGNIGFLYSSLGQYQKALDYDTQALTMRRRIGDRDGEAAILQNIGRLYSAQSENQKALDFYEQSMAIVQATGNRPSQAAILFAVGTLYSNLDENQKAVDSFNQAGKTYLALGDRLGAAATLSSLGGVYSHMGEKLKALACYTQALPLERAVGDRAGEAATLSGAAQSLFDLGQNDRGLEMLNRALELARAAGDRTGEARTLSNLGTIYSQTGDKQKALDSYEQALPVQRATGDRPGEAVTLANLGVLYADLGEQEKALDYANQALPIMRAIGDRSGEAAALRTIGEVDYDLGEKQKALDSYNQALPLDLAVYDLRGQAALLNDMGSAYFQLGDMPKALDSWNRALPLYRATGDVIGEANQMLELLAYWYKQQKLDMAIFYGTQAIQRFEQVRRNIRGMSKEAQESFLQSKAGYYRALANVLIKAGRLSEAQQVLDLVKEEEYGAYTQTRGGGEEGLPSANVLPATPAEKKNSDEYQKLAADVTAVGQQWSELNAKSPRTPEEEQQFKELSAKLTAANQQMQAFFNNLYTSFGKGDQANARVEEINEQTGSLQGLIGDPGAKTAVLYTLVLDDKLVIMVITPSARVAREVPIARVALRLKVNGFATALATHQPDEAIQAKAQVLYNLLIAPVEKDLEGAQVDTLVWSLDDWLRYVPMAALYDGKHYLVERYRNVIITTASIGNLKDQPQIANWHALAMGVSKDYDGLGQLKAVPGELDSVVHTDAVAGSHGPVPGTIMLNDAFTKESMEKALEQHPALVHIASHYFFRGGGDTKSYLLMGGDNVGGQGFHLTLADLRDDQRMDFHGIELLTLSGCQTAVGSQDSDGREIDGLGIVAQRKHAKAVMATLWPVDDTSVGLLMADFYRTWATTPGMTKSEALRQAQLALLHGAAGASGNHPSTAPYANPFYWAPFILIGNWK